MGSTSHHNHFSPVIAKRSEGWHTIQAFQLVNKMLKMSKREKKKANQKQLQENSHQRRWLQGMPLVSNENVLPGWR